MKFYTTCSDIQGLEHLSLDEIRQQIENFLEIKKEGWNIDGYGHINIIGYALHGSRARHTAREDSDLDVIFQFTYDGKRVREDDLFNYFNDEDLKDYIDGIEIDYNPIEEDLGEYLEHDKLYDEEMKSKLDLFESILDKRDN